jgi:hypothetical protein
MSGYKMSFTRNLSHISWTLLWLSLLTTVLLVNPIDNGIAILIVLILFIIPGIFLHIRYFLKDKNKTVELKSNNVEIILPKTFSTFKYSEISKIEHHYNFWPHKNPWGNYGYIKIFLNDNSIHSYTCLIQESHQAALFFQSKKVLVEKCEGIVPW